LYVPGLLPKPPPEQHREQLRRCLLAAVGRLDEAIADALNARSASFDLVSWTFDFYGKHRDIDLDLSDIEAALARDQPSEEDIADALGWKRRLMYAVYQTGDRLPFLIPRIANERMEVHLRDLNRYTDNDNGIADHVRRMLKVPLEAAAAAGRPVLLLTHSMGSVIAWDALWQMSRVEARNVPVDLWVTMGSPLGGNYLQQRLLGFDKEDAQRYPDNVRRWINVSAVGELTALDRTLANDFAPMLEHGLIDEIVDHEIFTFYREAGALNVHNEYGYLMHETTGRIVRDWWRRHQAPLSG